MKASRFLTAAEATTKLGVRLPTLYAYVSRGLIRSETTGGDSRTRRYNREDVEQLKERKEQRRNPARVAQQALHWGAPVLESALTLIADGKVYYRGYAALKLAATRSFEEVAGLLWTGELSGALFAESRAPQVEALVYPKAPSDSLALSRLELFQVVLALAAASDPAAYDLRPAAVAQTGARILRLLTASARGAKKTARGSVAESLQRSWSPGRPRAAELFNAALILCADHELNISAFTARCVASAGATPYAAVIAALSAFQGAKHGGHSKRVEALFHEIGSASNAHRVLANRLKRGETIPGFGHPLYPEGDPRGQMLIQMTAEAFPRARRIALAKTIADEAFRLIGEYPTIDFALVVLAQVLDLPDESAMTLFALGRTVGWIAHALEQYQLNELIRPRARYVGPGITSA
jgi:citrate synthase